METFRRLIESIEAEGAAALIAVVETAGSSPREAGARMVVRPSGGMYGTIGGGELEYEALEEARAALAAGRGPARRRSVALGPELGQCCGGRVVWRIETFDTRDLAALAPLRAAEREGPFVALARLAADGRVERRLGDAPQDGEEREAFGEATTPVYLFGAGHVGRALALALAPLPFAVRWIDPRPDEFPKLAPANVKMVAAADPPAELDGGARRRVCAGDDPFASARPRGGRRGVAPGPLRLCRHDRLGDQARALPQPVARGGNRRRARRQTRLPDRLSRNCRQGAGGDRRRRRRATADGARRDLAR